MHPGIQRILRSETIVKIGGGIALGTALLNVARQFGLLVLVLTSGEEERLGFLDSLHNAPGNGLAVQVGNHAVVLAPLLSALVSLAVVLVTLSFVLGRPGRRR